MGRMVGVGIWMLLMLSQMVEAQGTCANVAGNWKYSESGTITCSCSNGAVETAPIGNDGQVTIEQDGCNVSYIQPHLESFFMTGVIEGNTIQLFARYLPLFIAGPGTFSCLQTDDSFASGGSSYTATGEVSENEISLSGLGVAVGVLPFVPPQTFSCTANTTVTLAQCDFSSEPGEPERCFGGIGDRCKGLPFLQFIKDKDTCEVQGWATAGSILHDRCCIETNNTGAFCANPNGSRRCASSFTQAALEVFCGRHWAQKFGPYPVGNKGDDTTKNLPVPPGEKVYPRHAYLCSSGRCEVGTNGRTIIRIDPCGPYCNCE